MTTSDSILARLAAIQERLDTIDGRLDSLSRRIYGLVPSRPESRLPSPCSPMGTRLAAFCMARLVTLGELADHLHISRKYLYMLRAGTRHAWPKLLRKIAAREQQARSM